MVMRVLAALLLASCLEQAPVRVPAPVVGPGATEWLERPTRTEEERPEIVIRAMNLKNGDVVADVGAGTGFYTRRLARAVGPEGIVYANDIQPEMLEALRANAERERITNIVPILGTETDPKLPKGALDWVLLVDVYHELQQPQPVLQAIRASLKPDGRVALVEYRETTERVRPDHRMTQAQVLAEWLPAGFRLERVIEEMPMQRLYVFSVNR